MNKIVLFLCISIAFCLNALEKDESLVVGTASGYAPYVSLNGQGEYVGFDIDFARLVAAKLNKKLVLRDLGSMPSLLLALQKQKIDAVIWAVSITQERQKEMAMIYYQGEKVQKMPFIFWKEVPKGIERIEDLGKNSNSVIAVEAGSFQDAVVRAYPNLKLRYVDKISDALLEIKFGKAFTAPIDPSLVAGVQAKTPQVKVLYLPLPEELQAQGNGICISKSNSLLIEQVRDAIKALREEGKIQELERKWNLCAP